MNSLGERILKKLKEKLRIRIEEYTSLLARTRDQTPFSILVATILSQNTSDKNSIRAYNALRKGLGISPYMLANADTRDIERLIKPAGLYSRKARILKTIAKIIVDKYHGDDWSLVNGDIDVVRERLLSLPGVGEKTADVVLMTVKNADVFPVDTHAKRIAYRLGIISDPHAGYKEISAAYCRLFKGKCREAHLYIIALGRYYCKAKKPRCQECPLRKYCAMGKSIAGNVPHY